MRTPAGRINDTNDEGFTLIELMVVVLIIGILMAIAIPTFLGAKNSANARSAQSNLRNALTAEASYFTANNQAFGAAGVLTESALRFNVAGGATPDTTPVTGTNAAASATSTGNSVDVWNPVAGGTANASVMLGEVGADGNSYYVYDQNGQIAYYTVAKGSGDTGYQTVPTFPTSNSDSKGHWGSQW